MSHLSTSALMASYLSKTQVNNYLNYTPPKSNYTPSTDATRDFSIKPSSSYSPNGYKYSPELDGFRREVNDQIRNLFYSLTSEMKALKKENGEYKFQLDEIRREVETTNSKLVQFKSSHNAEINTLRNNISLGATDGEQFKPDETMKNNWAKNTSSKIGDFTGDINEINDKISQVSRQVQNLTAEMEGFKKSGYITRETFSKSLSDIVDELERKLGIINDRVKERIEEMDASLMEALKEKDQDCQKLYYDIRNVQSSMIRVSDQVNTYTHSNEMNLEEQVRKIMNNYSADIKNISTIANSTEQKLKMLRKDDSVVSPLLSSTLTQTHNEEFKTKLRELDSIYQTVTLLEKELRAKTDMVDLNINSIKRNLELELSIQIKHMILPIQKNIDQYLQTTEGRFSALEDAVLNHMKRDSYVMTAERANRFRNSHNEESQQYLQAPSGYNGSSNVDSYGGFTEERNRSSGDFKSFANNPSISAPISNNSGPVISIGGTNGFKERLREKERERLASQPFKIDEVDSVLSMGDVHQKQQEDKLLSEDLRTEPAGGEIQETEEVEEEQVLDNYAEKVLPDKDRNKQQKPAEKLFPNAMEPSSQPESLFRDFPSTQAMKSNLETEHPDNRKTSDRLSAKKKKPEIDVSDNVKTNPKDTVKKLSIKDSPINLDSKLILGTESMNGDEITPPANFRAPREDTKKKERESSISVEKTKESDEQPPEEFAGNIKGLLRKSRNNKRDNTPSLEEVDRSSPPPQRGKSTDNKKGGYGQEPVTNQFNKNPPQQNNKGLDKKAPLGPIGGGGNNNLSNSNSKLKQELPPVDTKSVKNFNKGGKKDLPAPRGPGGFNNQQHMRNPNNYYGGAGGYDNNGWGQGNEEDESVEEIVYHVDEEGFLVDEQGNYLVDEQGNFLQLSPDQMKEIEEKDLVYEKEF